MITVHNGSQAGWAFPLGIWRELPGPSVSQAGRGFIVMFLYLYDSCDDKNVATLQWNRWVTWLSISLLEPFAAPGRGSRCTHWSDDVNNPSEGSSLRSAWKLKASLNKETVNLSFSFSKSTSTLWVEKAVITCSEIQAHGEDCDTNPFLVQFSLRKRVLGSRTDGWNPVSRQQKPQYPSGKLPTAGGHSHPSPFTFSLWEEGGPPQCNAKGRTPTEFTEISAEARDAKSFSTQVSCRQMWADSNRFDLWLGMQDNSEVYQPPLTS